MKGRVTMCNVNGKGAIDFLLFSYFGFDSTDSEPFKKVKAAHRAYLDLARTVKYRFSMNNSSNSDKYEAENFKKHKKELINSICNKIYDFQSYNDNFEEWHKKTCEWICEEMNNSNLLKENEAFTYGQAQKWVNMTLKYLWMLNLLPKEIKEESLHVPIDGYILEKLKELKVDKITGSNETYYYNRKVWSAINENDYLTLEEEIKKIADKENKSPIHWENEKWLNIAVKRRNGKANNNSSNFAQK